MSKKYFLEKAELNTTQLDDDGREVDATYWLHVRDENAYPPAVGVYSLEVVTTDLFASWYMEKIAEGDTEPNFPHVIPEEALEGTTLTKYMERTYFDPQTPGAINELAQFLIFVTAGSD